jgi:penicillin-binding protein 1A
VHRVSGQPFDSLDSRVGWAANGSGVAAARRRILRFVRLRRRKVWPHKRRRIRKLRLAVLLLVLLALSLVSFTYGLITAVAGEIPELDPARIEKREQNGYIYDRRGQKILAVLRGSESRVLVDSSEIAPVMKHAIVAIEDKRFYEHRGVDLRAIARAFWADVRQKVVQGGSTITQQFIKNALIEDERSIGRKLKEAALAWQLTKEWSKDKILTEYLNTIYFGNGAYGIQQAALTYFKHGASKLTLAEAALLAGIPSDPARYDPVANPRAARARRALVLRSMLEQGLVTRTGYRKAVRAPLPEPDQIRLPGTLSPEDAPYFVNYVLQQLIDKYGTAEVFGGGLKVRTTIDLELQAVGRQAIAKWLTRDEGPEAALVAVNPQNGDVLAMIGGSNFRESQFNLAVQGERQPGSSFKPFVLAAALHHGISPENTFASKEIDIPFENRVWHVENYEGSYLGSADLETATIHSDNSVYAQLTSLVGPENVATMARQLGIRSDLAPYLSIGLGAQAVNPLEMARAYSAFANGGLRIDGRLIGNRPRAIAWVRRHGELRRNEPDKKRVLSPAKGSIVNSLLQKVISRGTGRAAVLPGYAAAGKTGTTENHGDAWFVGYTPRLAVAVWVGYPTELRPMLTEFNGEPVAGGTWPARIWRTFMLEALKRLELRSEPFSPAAYLPASPRYVVFREGRLELDNGQCRNAVQLLVFSGEGPNRTADCKPNEVEVPTLVRSKLTDARARLAAEPLTPKVVLKPARPGQRPGIVVRQIPPNGTLTAYDEVTLVVTKPLHGVVPRVVGLRLERALSRLRRAKLRPVVPDRDDGDLSRRIVRQSPAGGVAAAPGMSVRLVLRRK